MEYLAVTKQKKFLYEIVALEIITSNLPKLADYYRKFFFVAGKITGYYFKIAVDSVKHTKIKLLH